MMETLEQITSQLPSCIFVQSRN